jgi:hypothetical protein
METEVLGALTQFGVAGMVCAMWLIERRASGMRERQITESHTKLIGQIDDRAALVEVIKENTRALSLLEAGQRGLLDVISGRNAVVPMAGRVADTGMGSVTGSAGGTISGSGRGID